MNAKKKYLDVEIPLEDLTLLDENIRDILKNKDDYHSLLNKIYSSKRKEEILKGIEEWDKIASFLEYPFQLSGNNEIIFEEIIYSIPQTKKLFDKYLNHPDQSPTSLDLNQSLHLFNDVVFYLLELPNEERLTFFREYLNRFS